MKQNAICMLNYNGYLDTIECIESIIKYENINEITILLLDNGSNDELYSNLETYFNELYNRIKVPFKCCNLDEASNVKFQDYNLVLVKSPKNYGFARGNNLLIEVALREEYKYITLLNNDTVFTMPSITRLSEFLDTNSIYNIATSNILYYSDNNKVWNAGGKLFFGTRKYNTNKAVSKKMSKGENILPVDFITGCFMMVRKEIFQQLGLLTDKFFFGEEDYEFCMRMKTNKVKMCVILDTEILHKVGSTIKKEDISETNLNKTLCHHLNRYIDMKYYYPNLKWVLWTQITNCYIFLFLTLRRKKGFLKVFKYIYILNKLSFRYNGVSKELFDKIIKCTNLNRLLNLD